MSTDAVAKPPAPAAQARNASIDARRVAAMPRGIGIGFNLYAERALNAELWDVEGRRYIDFCAGIAVLNTGHRHSPRCRGAGATREVHPHGLPDRAV